MADEIAGPRTNPTPLTIDNRIPRLPRMMAIMQMAFKPLGNGAAGFARDRLHRCRVRVERTRKLGHDGSPKESRDAGARNRP